MFRLEVVKAGSAGSTRSAFSVADFQLKTERGPGKAGKSEGNERVLSDENKNKTSQTRAFALIALRRRRRNFFGRMCRDSLRNRV